MATSLKYPTVLAQSGAGNSWVNLSNAAGAPATAFATLGADGAAKVVDVTAASLAFAIPAGATINGITATVYEANLNEGPTYNLAVTLKKSGATTETKTTTGISAGPTVFGSAADKWASSWTASDINSNLTVHLQFTLGAGASTLFGFDGVGVTVYYTVNGRTTKVVRVVKIKRV